MPVRALEQIAHVASEAVACRTAGFSFEALRYPRSPEELKALCEFNGLPDHVEPPRGWHYFPNATMRDWWRQQMRPSH